MKSYHMSMGAGLDGLVPRQHEVPQPGPNEVLLRVHAVSLNYRELMILQQGRYPLQVKPDVVGMCDGAGEVAALGAGVSRAKQGDRVIASLGGSLDGMLTEYAVLHEDALVTKLRPVIARVFGFDEAPAALACYAEGRSFGKVVIRVTA